MSIKLSTIYPTPISYKPLSIGDRVTPDSRVEYIVAHFSYDHVGLINLSSGHRWSDPVKVKKITAITGEEFQRIIGENFGDWSLVGRAWDV